MRLPLPRFLCLLTVPLLALVAACDNDPTRPDPITLDFAGTAAAVGQFTQHDFTSDRRGIATATLRWTTGDLDFAASANTCNTSPFTCLVRVFSVAGAGTSEVLKFGVTENEVFRLWILNFNAPLNHPYTIEVVLE
jgi:hypothetical protein